jgi:hypothetical protein
MCEPHSSMTCVCMCVCVCVCLCVCVHAGVLIDILAILSQVARVSKDNYDALAAGIVPGGAPAAGADLLFAPLPALLRYGDEFQ